MNRSRELAFFAGLALVAAVMVVVPRLIVAAPVPVGAGNVPMAWTQKIFYFHVPVAWCTFLSVFVCAVGSIAHLARRSPLGAAVSAAAAELVVVFGICTLVTGPLWARKEWGVWWVWKDVRLVTTLILWLTFIAFLFVRRYGGPGSDKLASGLAIFGAVNVPIVYKAVDFWRTQHPKATVVSEGMPGAMLLPFLLSLGAFTVLYTLLFVARTRLERARQRLDELHLAADEAGLLEG
jgi:heme exporter protein C